MERPYVQEAVYRKMVDIIVEALRVDPESVTMEANLFYDLGAESIDMLDIRFRIQEELQVKVDREELIQSLGEGLTDSEIVRRFTVAALVRYVEQKMQAPESIL